jgi:hypothetical protein
LRPGRSRTRHAKSYWLFLADLHFELELFRWRTGASLLLMMLWHSAVNQTVGIAPAPLPNARNPFALGASFVGWLTVVLLWILAAFLLFRMRSAVLDSPSLVKRDF